MQKFPTNQAPATMAIIMLKGGNGGRGVQVGRGDSGSRADAGRERYICGKNCSIVVTRYELQEYTILVSRNSISRQEHRTYHGGYVRTLLCIVLS
jgi:hypothetical protein